MLGKKCVALLVAAGLMILAASGAQADSSWIAKIQDGPGRMAGRPQLS